MYLPIIAVTSIFAGSTLPINRLLYAVIALVIGFLLNGLLSLIVGFLAFWLTEIWGIAAIRNLLTGLLAGATFPLDILPQRIQTMMLATPFPYMSYVPSKLLCDPSFNLEIVYKGMFISLSWVVILSTIAFLMMRCGLKKYTASGV